MGDGRWRCSICRAGVHSKHDAECLPCKACRGLGWTAGYFWCDACDGQGRVPLKGSALDPDTAMMCPDCGGVHGDEEICARNALLGATGRWAYGPDENGGSRDVFFDKAIVVRQALSSDAIAFVDHANRVATAAIEHDCCARIEDETAAKIAAWLRESVFAGTYFDTKQTRQMADAVEKGEWRKP